MRNETMDRVKIYKYKINISPGMREAFVSAYERNLDPDDGIRAALEIVERDLNNGAVSQVGRPVGCVRIVQAPSCDSPAVDVVGIEHPWNDAAEISEARDT